MEDFEQPKNSVTTRFGQCPLPLRIVVYFYFLNWNGVAKILYDTVMSFYDNKITSTFLYDYDFFLLSYLYFFFVVGDIFLQIEINS